MLLPHYTQPKLHLVRPRWAKVKYRLTNLARVEVSTSIADQGVSSSGDRELAPIGYPTNARREAMSGPASVSLLTALGLSLGLADLGSSPAEAHFYFILIARAGCSHDVPMRRCAHPPPPKPPEQSDGREPGVARNAN